jgi:hypothetical protein
MRAAKNICLKEIWYDFAVVAQDEMNVIILRFRAWESGSSTLMKGYCPLKKH